MKRMIYGVLVALCGLLMACSNSLEEEASEQSATTTEREMTLCVGKETLLALPVDETVTDATFASSDTKVATVDKEGLVKAVAVGTCTISINYTTVESGEHLEKIKLSVVGLTTASE